MSTAFTTLSIGRIAPPRVNATGFKEKMAAGVYLLSVLSAAFIEMFIHGRLNVAGGLIAVSGMMAGTLIFYRVLSPAHRKLALLVASFNVLGLAFEALRLQPQGMNIAILFDGFSCILIGYLVFRSTRTARILAALMALGGLGWLTFLSSPLAHYLSPYNLAFGLLGEASVCLWLVVMGTNVQQRRKQADVPGEQRSKEALHI